MKDKLKKLTIVFVFVLANSFPIITNAATVSCKSYQSNRHCVRPTDKKEHIEPVYDTQTQHRLGYETIIGMSSSNTTSLAYTGSLSFKFSTGFFIASSEVSGSVGVTNSESNTISVTTSYRIDRSTPNGKYRIVHKFPYYTLKYETYSLDGQHLSTDETKLKVPGRNESYKDLQRYAN